MGYRAVKSCGRAQTWRLQPRSAYVVYVPDQWGRATRLAFLFSWVAPEKKEVSGSSNGAGLYSRGAGIKTAARGAYTRLAEGCLWIRAPLIWDLWVFCNYKVAAVALICGHRRYRSMQYLPDSVLWLFFLFLSLALVKPEPCLYSIVRVIKLTRTQKH